jgi:hypothetical protein
VLFYRPKKVLEGISGCLWFLRQKLIGFDGLNIFRHLSPRDV